MMKLKAFVLATLLAACQWSVVYEYPSGPDGRGDSPGADVSAPSDPGKPGDPGKPDKPDKPDKPGKPGDPAKPDKPDKPDKGKD